MLTILTISAQTINVRGKDWRTQPELQNTIIKAGDELCTFDGNPFDWAIWRNNLAFGGTTDGWDRSQVTDGYSPGSGYACNINACGSNCSFDYDAVGTNKTTWQARINRQNFNIVEPHGRKIDSTAFVFFSFPSPPAPEPTYYYQPQDLRPAPSCTSIIDKALLIPNVNDSYLGSGPDIGAYEAGQNLPVYGPRPEGVDEQTPPDKQDTNPTILTHHTLRNWKHYQNNKNCLWCTWVSDYPFTIRRLLTQHI